MLCDIAIVDMSISKYSSVYFYLRIGTYWNVAGTRHGQRRQLFETFQNWKLGKKDRLDSSTQPGLNIAEGKKANIEINEYKEEEQI